MAEANAAQTGAGETNQDGDFLDGLIDAMGKMKSPETDTRSFEEQLEDLDKHPAFMKEIDPSKPLSADMEGLMQLKYQSEDPTASAEAFKEDGNHEFQKKKYRIAVDNYTEGIKCQCPDKYLNAILYTNRAAAQFHIGNFRTSYNDCMFARKFKPDHMKAIHRGALCCMEMKKYEEAMKWCDDGLAIEPGNTKLIDTRKLAVKQQKAVERDKRKEQQQDRKILGEDLELVQAIQSRGIKLAGTKQCGSGDARLPHPDRLLPLETHTAQRSKVNMDAKKVLYWPVMFLYPEHTETDYIQVFCENHRLIDHLNHMFGVEAEPPPWDKDRRYKPHTVNVYFEEKEKDKLHKVNKESTLLKVLQNDRYCVYGGTPAFIIMVAGSPFEKSFLQRYTS